MFQNIDDTIERDGFTLRARIEHDSDTGAPWEEHDGHGPVSDWECRDKLPGELILCGPSYGMGRMAARRFYDFAEACRIARRDGWNAKPYDVPGETPRQCAAKAARADFEHLRGWCNDQWNWCGVVVTASRAGVELGTASLWGIESNAGAYLVEVANELAAEAQAEAAERAAAILDAPQYLVAGEKLWNGAEVSPYLAAAYNRLTDKIEQFKMEGRRVPEELLNGRHNLIASA